MRRLLYFAFCVLHFAISQGATMSSPAPGALCTMPAWGARSIDAAHTPGNLATYRVDQQLGLAMYAAYDGMLERVFYSHEVYNTNAILRTAIAKDFDVGIYGVRCDATNRNFHAAGRRVVVPRDFHTIASESAGYVFPAAMYADFYLPGTDEYIYFDRPLAWSSSIIEGPDDVPSDIDWVLYADQQYAFQNITNGVTTKNFQPGGAFKVEAYGRDWSVYSDYYITSLAQATTFEDALTNSFPNVSFPALTNNTLRFSTLSDAGRIGAFNAALASLDVTYYSGAFSRADDFAVTNHERIVKKTARSTTAGTFSVSNGTVTCSADFGNWNITTAATTTNTPVAWNDSYMPFYFNGGTLRFESGAATAGGTFADLYLDWEFLTNFVNLAVAEAARVLDEPDKGTIRYEATGLQIDDFTGNSVVVSGVLQAHLYDGDQEVLRGSIGRVFTMTIPVPATATAPVAAAVTATAHWDWDDVTIPSAQDTRFPERPGYHAWADGKVRKAQAFVKSEACLLLDTQGYTDDTNDFVRVKRHEYTSAELGRASAHQERVEVYEKVKELVLEQLDFDDIESAVEIDDGDLESLARTMRITGAGIELSSSQGVFIILAADDTDAGKLASLRLVGSLGFVCDGAIDPRRETQEEITKDAVRGWGGEIDTIFRIDWNWGNLRINR